MAIEQNGIFSDWKVLFPRKGTGSIRPVSLAPLLDNEINYLFHLLLNHIAMTSLLSSR